MEMPAWYLHFMSVIKFLNYQSNPKNKKIKHYEH